MKTVLIVDASPMLRNFLVMKLEDQNLRIETCESQRDAFTKTISLLPDLIIADIADSFYPITDYLERKSNNPNTKDIPTVLCGPVAENEQIDDLVSYGVIKYFNKPVRFDIFFTFLGNFLKTVFTMDTTPCILEMHLNDDILFIEIAQGLNRDKLSLLKYKLPEVFDKAKLSQPKIIVMLTDLSLSFEDAINLETLFTAILSDRRVRARNVKVLSFDSFTKELIEGHSELKGIDVANNLQKVLYTVVDTPEMTDVAEFINDRILSSTSDATAGTLGMEYDPQDVAKGLNKAVQNLDGNAGIESIAVIDPDVQSFEFIKHSFKHSNVYSFRTAQEFLSKIDEQHFDVVILELNLQGMNGLDVLKVLQGKHYIDPIIIYSSVIDKTLIYKAISLGARTYLVKPQKSEVLVKKVKDVVSADF